MAKTDIGVMSKLRLAYDNLGRTLGTKLPYDEIDRKGMSNQAASEAVDKHNACLDFAKAHMIASAAKKDCEDAKSRMVVSGVLGDFDNLTAGVTHVTYDTRELSVTVKVNNGSKGSLDEVAFTNELAKTFNAKDYEKIVSLMRKCTPPKQGARTVAVTLKEPK